MTTGQLLMQVCRLTGYRMRVKMEKVGLHRGQGATLFFLWRHEGVPQTEIGRSLHLAPASVTDMLQRMERDGWIERKPDPHDQRISRVYLTAKAKALHEEARASFSELDEEVTGALTENEQSIFRQLLAKVHARLVEELPPGRQHLPDKNEGGKDI